MSVQRTAFWLKTERGPLFSWLHAPLFDTKPAAVEKLGIVICNPFGHEYTHSHRSFRHLADALAGAGYPTLRFDYHGTGNSDATMRSPHRIDAWLEDIQAEINWLKQNTGVTAICLIGLQFGATLAALSCTKQPIDYLIMWSPCVKGKKYARILTSLSKMAVSPSSNNGDFFETAGFLISTETLEKLKSINLTNEPLTVKKRILVLNRDDISTNDNYSNFLTQHNNTVDTQDVPGFLEMLAEPQETKVPDIAISTIVTWISQYNPAINVPSDSSTQYLALKDDACNTEFLHVEGDIQESLILVEQTQPLFGVLTQSKQNKDIASKPLIIFSNSGSVHHVGPNRLYVHLSRSLAKAGFDCFRYDHNNLGDSCCNATLQENHPYPTSAMENLTAVIEHMQYKLGYQKFILTGVCSGSHVSFHTGLILKTHPILESILINPLTFYWKEGMSLDIPSAHQVNKDAKHYGRASKNLHNWIRLLKGQVNIKYVVKFTVKYICQKMCEIMKNTLEHINIMAPSRLGQDLLRHRKIKRNISIIFARSDPGYKILVSEAKVVTKEMLDSGDLSLYFIENADHTFSKHDRRVELTDTLIQHLTRYHSKPTL